MKIPAKNAGRASSKSLQSISLKEDAIRTPTITRAGAVAAEGTALTKAAKKAERAKIEQERALERLRKKREKEKNNNKKMMTVWFPQNANDCLPGLF